MIGLAMGAFQWTVSPWFITLKQALAEWLVERDIFWPLEANAPWWLLTHYPQVNDAFTWLDGTVILLYIFGCSLLIGSALWLLLRGATWLMGRGGDVFEHLALALTPLGGAGLFLGLSATTVKLLRYEGLALDWAQPARAALLFGAIAGVCFWPGRSSACAAATACVDSSPSRRSSPPAHWSALVGICSSGAGAEGTCCPRDRRRRSAAQHEGRK